MPCYQKDGWCDEDHCRCKQTEEEIKFREWNVMTKTMSIPNELQNPWKQRRDGKYIMQFTGIKDKNGKDVYENDIIKIKNLFIGSPPLGGALITEEIKQVKHLQRGWYPFLETDTNGRYKYIIESGEIKSPLNLFNPTYIEGCEIIGNLYETPELLSKK